MAGEKKRYVYADITTGKPLFIADSFSELEKDRYQIIELGDGEELDLEQASHYVVVQGGKIVVKEDHTEKIAVISNYGVNCGIATYTKYLCDEMRGLCKELKIFAEETTERNATASDQKDNVVRCWKRNSDYSRLPYLLEEFAPDLIIIQHEFGLFHQLNFWNSLVAQLSRIARTVVTFHTVLEHRVENVEASLDYTTRFLAESACGEIIVHSPFARDCLRARGFSGAVHYIPHGCFKARRLLRLPSQKYGMFPEHSLIQFGFGGEYKGWETAIEVVDRLREKYPNIFYLGIFNTGGDKEGFVRYYDKLTDLIHKKELQDHVALNKQFQGDAAMEILLRSCRAAIFPYKTPSSDWASWGASGAVHFPLALGLPVVLSSYPAFQEFEKQLPLCENVDQYVQVVDKIFSDPSYEKQMSETCFSLAEKRQWPDVARHYLACRPKEDYNAL